eukprot:TRINITY_DN15392_c0_g1_i1.p2 TRINITY_DN15392_c0_g1~~TRINITY_DN15392_c0_g1_i1.p2  ORF type:complete len:455 (+),score=78.56 TRINITY_DN15392_c0_g1_i1:1119-2483(+)
MAAERSLRVVQSVADLDYQSAIAELRERGGPTEGFDTPTGTLLQLLDACIASGAFADAQVAWLAIREHWYRHQTEATPQTFAQFNAPYQAAFERYYRFVASLPPQAKQAAGGVQLPARTVVPCDLAGLGAPVAVKAVKKKPAALSVASFNVLSDKLAWAYSYQFVDPEPGTDLLDWRYRLGLVVQELKRASADIVCLQEVDNKDWPGLLATVGELGYTGVHSPRIGITPAEGGKVQLRDLKYGICTLWKEKKLVCISTERVDFGPTGGSNLATATVLHWLDDGRRQAESRLPVIVGNCHLQADAASDDQAICGCAIARTLVAAEVRFGQLAALVCCGDFNGVEGPLRAMSTERPGAGPVPFLNAYGLASKAMRSGTTAVVTCHNNIYHRGGNLDGVLFDPTTLRAAAVLDIPDKNFMDVLGSECSVVHPRKALPNASYPSDHFALFVEFEWANN